MARPSLRQTLPAARPHVTRVVTFATRLREVLHRDAWVRGLVRRWVPPERGRTAP